MSRCRNQLSPVHTASIPLSLSASTLATLAHPCSSRAACAPAIRELRLEDIPSAASLLSDAFAPPDGYNPLQRRIIVC